MEARLLCLENVGTLTAYLRKLRQEWIITNGTGIPISQEQIPKVPPPLFTADIDRKHLIEDLTEMLAKLPFCFAEPGWSNWQLHHIGEIEYGYFLGPVRAVSVIIVRSSVVQAQATSEASVLDGGK